MTYDCFSEIEIEGPEEEIVSLRNLLKEWLSTKTITTEIHGTGWLGDIAEKAGMDLKKVPCYGFMYLMTDEVFNRAGGYKFIRLYMETESVPLHEIWKFILKKYAPHCKYIFDAMNRYTELWQTNDISQVGNICIDLLGNRRLQANLGLDEGPNYFTKEKFEKWAKRVFHTQSIIVNNIRKKLKKYCAEYDAENGTESNVYLSKAVRRNPIW